MAYEIPGFSYTLEAAVDLRSSLYCGASINASGKAKLPGAGAGIMGVINNKPNTGEATTLVHSGISMMKAAGEIPLLDDGTPVKVDATGAIVAQGGTGVIVGWALEAASGAGAIIAVLLVGRPAA